MPAVIYCRVSTKEQTKNLSLTTQEEACLRWCADRGIEVAEIFREEGESAKTTDRTQLTRLRMYCEKNRRRIDTLLVYNLNRLSRNATDFMALKASFSKLGIKLRSVTDPTDDSPSGQFMETILAGAAQYDNDVKALRTKDGMLAALKLGRWTWQAPLGYRTNPVPKSSPCMLPDEHSAPLVLRAFELVNAGEPPVTVLARVTKEGLRTAAGKRVSHQTFGKLLRNPIYAGRVYVPNWSVDCKGDFAAIVSTQIFSEVQRRLDGKKSAHTAPRRRDHPDFPLRRFIRCQRCGRPLTASWAKGRNRSYPYYRCVSAKCSVNIRRDELETQFSNLLGQMQPHPRYVRLLEAVVRDVWAAREADRLKGMSRAEEQLAEVERRRRTLVDAYLYEKKIDAPTYEVELSRLGAEKERTSFELTTMRSELGRVEDLVWFAEHVLCDLRRSWQNFSSEEKVRFQYLLLPRGASFDGENIGTAETASFFRYLQPKSGETEGVASPTGFEPVLAP